MLVLVLVKSTAVLVQTGHALYRVFRSFNLTLSNSFSFLCFELILHLLAYRWTYTPNRWSHRTGHQLSLHSNNT